MAKKKYDKIRNEVLLNEEHQFGAEVDVKTPPNAKDLESMLLGAIMLDNIVMNDVLMIVDHRHFYSPRNGIIFQAMINLDGRREPVDVVTLKEELKKMKKLEGW